VGHNPGHTAQNGQAGTPAQQELLAGFYNEPFVVGAHWFIWSDFDSPVRQANRGLFKRSGEPWVELQEAFREVIGRMAK